MLEQTISSSTMEVSKMITYLTKAYVALIKNKVPLKKFPSVMLWGPPGVGKSQGVRQVAKEIEERTGKKVYVTDVRLLLFNPVDLRGIPTANAEKTLAVWLKPQIFQMNPSEDIVNILFLDEISAAPQSVQAAAYQITLDRTIGEHKLPENCIVIAAGNRITDKSVAYQMPKALANRLCHLEIKGQAESWHDWAVTSGIHEMVLGFIDCNPEMLMQFDATEKELAFATPRSWEMVSNILNYISDNLSEVFPLIIGCVGEVAAYEFRVWTKLYNQIPDVKHIFEGKPTGIPTRPEIMYATTSQIVSRAIVHHSEEEMENVILYANRLSLEFKSRIFNDLLKIKEIRKYLYQNEIYHAWFIRAGYDWDDYL